MAIDSVITQDTDPATLPTATPLAVDTLAGGKLVGYVKILSSTPASETGIDPLTDTQLRASAVPVSMGAVPVGGATAAKQDTGNTSVASIDTKTPSLGQALAAASVPVILPVATITTLTPPAAITGFATAVKQGIAGTDLTGGAGAVAAGTQRVTLASDDPAVTKLTAAAASFVKLEDAASASGDAGVALLAVEKITPANTGGTDADYGLLQSQGGALWVRDLMNSAVRSAISLTLDGYVVAATADTMMATMTSSVDNGANSGSINDYTVTAGKRFRIQQIVATLNTVAGNTTAAMCIVRIRTTATGAVSVTSPLQGLLTLGGTAAANAATTLPVVLSYPDGWELVAGNRIGFSVACANYVVTVAAPKIDLTLIGYEY